MIYTSRKAPGFMIYFDLRSMFNYLPDCDAGILIKAIFAYADEGIVPDFGDNIPLKMIWDSIASRINADQARYSERVLSNSYASYVRTCKLKEIKPVSKGVWLEAQHNGIDLAGAVQSSVSISAQETKNEVVDDLVIDDDIEEEFVFSEDETLPF